MKLMNERTTNVLNFGRMPNVIYIEKLKFNHLFFPFNFGILLKFNLFVVLSFISFILVYLLSFSLLLLFVDYDS